VEEYREMLSVKNWKVLVAVCSLLVGILLMYQLKTWSKTNQNGEGQLNTIFYSRTIFI
jgi:hypothetical protein